MVIAAPTVAVAASLFALVSEPGLSTVSPSVWSLVAVAGLRRGATRESAWRPGRGRSRPGHARRRALAEGSAAVEVGGRVRRGPRRRAAVASVVDRPGAAVGSRACSCSARRRSTCAYPTPRYRSVLLGAAVPVAFLALDGTRRARARRPARSRPCMVARPWWEVSGGPVRWSAASRASGFWCWRRSRDGEPGHAPTSCPRPRRTRSSCSGWPVSPASAIGVEPPRSCAHPRSRSRGVCCS